MNIDTRSINGRLITRYPDGSVSIILEGQLFLLTAEEARGKSWATLSELGLGQLPWSRWGKPWVALINNSTLLRAQLKWGAKHGGFATVDLSWPDGEVIQTNLDRSDPQQDHLCGYLIRAARHYVPR